MRWLGLVLLGPALWAFMFALIYALHGWVCAGVMGPEGSDIIARVALLGVWALGLATFVPLFRIVPRGRGLFAALPRTGLWIGLAATLFTLFPVAIASSC